MTIFHKYAATALMSAALSAGAADAGRASELDEALRPRDISHIVELKSLDVPVMRLAASTPAPPPAVAPQEVAPVAPAEPEREPGGELWRFLQGLFSS